jgi:hypothetical protein
VASCGIEGVVEKDEESRVWFEKGATASTCNCWKICYNIHLPTLNISQDQLVDCKEWSGRIQKQEPGITGMPATSNHTENSLHTFLLSNRVICGCEMYRCNCNAYVCACVSVVCMAVYV